MKWESACYIWPLTDPGRGKVGALDTKGDKDSGFGLLTYLVTLRSPSPCLPDLFSLFVSLGPVYTMDHEVGPWKMAFFHSPISWSNCLKNQFTKSFGLSLGVNQMWTKRNDYTPKSGCADFFIYIPEKTVLRKKNNRFWPFSCLHLLSPQYYFIKNYYNNISLSWALAFYLLDDLSCLSHRKIRWTMLVDNVGIKVCLFGTSNSMVTLIFFPWCKPKWSRDEFNNQSHILNGLGTTSWSIT